MNKRCLLIGMGGHSKVVADVAHKCGYDVLGCLDDRAPESTTPFVAHLGKIAEFERFLPENVEFFIAIGNNAVRKQLAERLAPHGVHFATLIDPSAVISASAVIESGTVIMPGVVINADAHIGQHAIINTGATIDHDCWINHFTHVSPGAHLAGAVRVGNLAHVGIGASVIQNIHIGTGAVIGAGAAVIRNIPSYSTAVGVPAEVIKSYHP